MNDRIKKVRKYLNLNQEKFGEKLGVGKAAVSKMELGNYNLTDTMIKLICTEFNVNEKWLKYGTGEMFIENNSAIINELALEYKLDSRDIKFFETYLNLTPEQREALKEFSINFANAVATDEIAATKELSNEELIEMKLADVRKELEAELKGETSSASPTPSENLA